MITLQIITIVIPSTVYTVDPSLTVMTPFSTESGFDPPVSITMPITNNTTVVRKMLLIDIAICTSHCQACIISPWQRVDPGAFCIAF